MSIPPCTRCGARPPRILGLTAVIYGAYLGHPADSGYFHLCAACYQSEVQPHIDEEQLRATILQAQRPRA